MSLDPELEPLTKPLLEVVYKSRRMNSQMISRTGQQAHYYFKNVPKITQLLEAITAAILAKEGLDSDESVNEALMVDSLSMRELCVDLNARWRLFTETFTLRLVNQVCARTQRRAVLRAETVLHA